MTTITFETASIADAVKKAGHVAPERGKAFDQAAGLLFKLTPQDTSSEFCVKATNHQVWYTEWVKPNSIVGKAVTWRLPSSLMVSVLSSLPIGTGRTVTMSDEGKNLGDGRVLMTSGRMKAKINTLDLDAYADWEPFDTDNMIEVKDLGERFNQVEWAADKNGAIPFTGIHIDGKNLICTDRVVLAKYPLEIPGLDEPLTIPAKMLTGVISRMGPIKIASSGTNLHISPDEYIQITCLVYGQKFPSTKGIMKRDHEDSISFLKAELVSCINRAVTFTGSDRAPILKLFIGREEISVLMANEEEGLLGDVVEVPGQAQHKLVCLMITPQNILHVLSNAPSDKVTIHYNSDPEKSNRVVWVEDGSGYEAWVATRRDIQKQTD